jgi:hypothetical protein
MKFTAVFGSALPSSEGELDKRLFGSEIVTSIKNVQAGTNAVDAAVKQVTSANITQLLAVNTAAQQLGTILATETKNVKKQANLDIVGALNVQLATMDLIKAVQSLSTDIINIKPYVVQLGVTGVVLNVLKTQKKAADGFADAVAKKVPSLVASIAADDKKQVDAALNKAIQAYS